MSFLMSLIHWIILSVGIYDCTCTLIILTGRQQNYCTGHILAIHFMFSLPLSLINCTHQYPFIIQRITQHLVAISVSEDWTYIHFITLALLRAPLSLGVITHGWRPEQIELMTCYEWIPKKHVEDGISVVHQFIIASHQSKHSFYLVENRRCRHLTCQYECTFGVSSQCECMKVSAQVTTMCNLSASSVCTSEPCQVHKYFITVELPVWLHIGASQATTSYAALILILSRCTSATKWRLVPDYWMTCVNDPSIEHFASGR